MANLRIVSDNAVDRASSLVASSVSGLLAAANLLTDKKSQTWRAAGTAARVNALFSTAEVLGFVGLAFCNLSPTATMRVRMTNEASSTNLVAFSDNIAAWVTNGDTGTLGFYGIAPDGTPTTTYMANGTRYRTVAATIGTVYTYSYYVKSAGGPGAALYVDGMTPTLTATFTFSTKAFTGVSGGVTPQYKDIGGGWYRVALTFTATGTSFNVHVVTSGGAIEVWGGQVEVGGLTSYYPSLQTLASRSSGATYIDANGLIAVATTNVARMQYQYPSLGTVPARLLVEAAATNLLLYSEGINNAVWTKGATSIGSLGTDPAGGTAAYSVADTTNNSLHYLQQVITLAASTNYTLSVFAKASTCTKVQLINASLGAFANFDLVAGTVTSTGGTGYVTSNIQPFPNGWFRISLSFLSASASAQSMLMSMLNATGSTTYVGTGSTMSAWGFQCEVGRVATSYIGTAATTINRSADVLNTSGAGTRPLGYMDWWQSYTYDSGAVLCCPAPARVPRGLTAAQAASAYAYGGGTYARAWNAQAQGACIALAVDIVDTANLQGYIEAGRLIAGPYWSPVYNASAAPLSVVDNTETYENDAGDQLADAGTIRRKVSIDMNNMPPADRAVVANMLMNSRAYPILLSVFPNDTDFALERDYMVWGRRGKDSDIAIQNSVTYGISIPVVEV